MSLMIRLLLAPLLAIVLSCAAAPSSHAAQPEREQNTRHLGHYWAWFGPKSWDASYGTYGITVFGTQGAVLDLGFSSILCASGDTYATSVKNYFAGVRQNARKNYGWTITGASRIGHPQGSAKTYREQALTFTAKNGTVQGIGTFDYDFSDYVDGVNYCYQRSFAMYADTKPWRSRMGRVLTDIAQSLAYSGPGAPDEEPGMPVPGIGPGH